MKPRGRGSRVIAMILLSCCAALLIVSILEQREAPAVDDYLSARRFAARWTVEMPRGDVRVNEACAEEIEQLPGVGAALAGAILDERTARGSFYYPEDLLTVAGIGGKRLQAIWERLSMEEAKP